jgi:uncharacterized protein YjiS (DUF1127 family)
MSPTNRLSVYLPFASRFQLPAIGSVSGSSSEVDLQVTVNSFAQAIAAIAEDVRREGLVKIFAIWRARRNYRRELARLLIVGPHMIADIGLTADNTREEIARPFWRSTTVVS